MKKKRYDQEFKEQIVRECQEVGNTALVARRHGPSLPKTQHTVGFRQQENLFCCSFLPRNEDQRIIEVENRLETLAGE